MLALPVLASLLAAVPSLSPSVVTQALCGKKACKLLQATEVGRDADGRLLVLAGAEEVGGKAAEEDSGEPCVPQPYALLHALNGKVARVEPIVTVHGEGCEYGAHGGGEEVTLEGSKFSYQRYGGSNWGWSTTRTWSLVPELTPLELTQAGTWTVGPNQEELTTAFPGAVTRVRGAVPRCDAQGNLPEDPEKAPTYEFAYAEIPLVKADAATLKAGWKAPGYRPPALVVDSAGGDGFVIFGKPGKPEDARMRVTALSETVLLVDVADDQVVSGNPSWVKEDHLELWSSPQRVSYMDPCWSPGKDEAVAYQWGIRLTDAKVFAAVGKPEALPVVERVALDDPQWGKVTRLRIELPGKPGSVAVVYSDTDDGKAQKRLIGTSAVDLHNPHSLGAIHPVRAINDTN